MTDQTTDLRDRIAGAVRAFPFDNFGMDDVSYALEADPDAQEWVPALAAAVLAVLPEPTDQAAALSASERKFLTFALDQAAEEMALGDGFTADDEAALERLRRMADETQPASTAPLASGLPLIKGNCPACQRATLFLGTGGYVTCSNPDCTEPDAATTVLEQYGREADPPAHTWAAELYDPLAEEWVPGTWYLARDRAVNHLAHARAIGPTWKDGTPTRRRLVRATTTYTVEPEPTELAAPETQTPAEEQQP